MAVRRRGGAVAGGVVAVRWRCGGGAVTMYDDDYDDVFFQTYIIGPTHL